MASALIPILAGTCAVFALLYQLISAVGGITLLLGAVWFYQKEKGRTMLGKPRAVKSETSEKEGDGDP